MSLDIFDLIVAKRKEAKNEITKNHSLVKCRSKKSNFTPFLLAAYYGNIDFIKFLYDKKLLEINDKGYLNMTAFHFAALKDNYEIIKFLLEKGYNCNVPCDDEFLPMHVAARECANESLKYLCPKTDDINAVTKGNFTALHFATYNHSLECIDTLVRFRQNINIKDNIIGFNPLEMSDYLFLNQRQVNNNIKLAIKKAEQNKNSTSEKSTLPSLSRNNSGKNIKIAQVQKNGQLSHYVPPQAPKRSVPGSHAISPPSQMKLKTKSNPYIIKPIKK